MERRLAAILVADVVGYSRLMGEDEVGTLDALRAHREELFKPKILEHKGRIVKLMGDGLLAEFASAGLTSMGFSGPAASTGALTRAETAKAIRSLIGVLP